MKRTIAIIMLLSVVKTYAIEPCKGVSAKGEACKVVVGIKNGYCYRHQPDAKHCPYTSPKGKPCGMITKGGELCRFHSGK